MNLTKARHLPAGNLNFCAKTIAEPMFCRTRVVGATELGLTLTPGLQSRQTFSVGECLRSLNCVHTARTYAMLILKRASTNRPSGEWSDDDYDVFDGDRHIGRIMWTHAVSRDTPWF